MASESDRVLLDVRLSEGDISPGSPPPDAASTSTGPGAGPGTLPDVSRPIAEAMAAISDDVRKALELERGETPLPGSTPMPDQRGEETPSPEREVPPPEGPPRERTELPPILDSISVAEFDRELGIQQGERRAPPVIADPTPPAKPPVRVDPDSVFGKSVPVPNLLDQFGTILSESGPALPAFASSLVTHATGSPALGGIAGTAAGKLFGEGGTLAASAGTVAAGAAAVLVSSEIHDRVAQAIDAILEGTTRTLTHGGPGDPVRTGLGIAEQATQVTDPLQALTGINLNLMDDVIRSFIRSAQIVVDNLDKVGQQLGEFSGEVATAQAEAEVTRIQTQLRRAGQIGPEIATFVRTRSEGEAALEELKTAVMRELIPPVTSLTRDVTEFTRLVHATFNAFQDSPLSNADPSLILNGITIALSPNTWAFIQGVKEVIPIWKDLVQKQLDALRDKELEFQEEVDRFLDPAEFAGSTIGTSPITGPGMGDP